MKKLSLKNVQLSKSSLLSNEEKKQAVGGGKRQVICDCGYKPPFDADFECIYPKCDEIIIN